MKTRNAKENFSDNLDHNMLTLSDVLPNFGIYELPHELLNDLRF